MPFIGPKFDEYSTKYRNCQMVRHDGILELTFHTDGDSLVWTQHAHDELGYCFTDIAGDRENKVVILTGVGDSFCAAIDADTFQIDTPTKWDSIIYEGKRLLGNLLSIEVPVIGVVNGPAVFHPEIPILSDIVIAADTATFQDAPHFMSGVVPGDGAHVVWTHVLGPNRGRYFLLMGETLDAETAKAYGAVNEVVAKADAMTRAREIAATIASKPFLTRKYARAVLTHEWKRLMLEGIGLGLALEGLAAVDAWPKDGLLEKS